jgi:xeroderma pigmentosum group C-complementing protein
MCFFRRYAAERYDTQTRKARNPTESWLTEMINPFERKDRTAMDDEEDKQLVSISTSAPLPTTVGAFKSHPLYALSRHLLKFEAIYPPDAPPMGYIKSEPIYAREVVQSLQGRTSWLKEGRVVRIGQEPYKVVKARPKWDRMSGNVIKDQPLEVFGRWQTEIYIPPPAVDGKIPRNEYGNVELFKPWMLPKGTVHIPISGMYSIGGPLFPRFICKT